MKTIIRLFLLPLLSLACSLTTSPVASNKEPKVLNKIYLTTPTGTPNPILHTIPVACTVSAQSLHLRNCADFHCPVIAWLSRSDILIIHEKDQDWIKITTPSGQTGWVHSKYCGGLP